jgi:two-component system NtrC family sensor kinase
MNPLTVSTDISIHCRAIAEASPMPSVAVDGTGHLIRYVNPAFCTLTGKQKKDLIGSPFSSVLLTEDECLSMLGRVYRSGVAEVHTGQDGSIQHPFFWSYAMSPVLGVDDCPIGIFIRVTEATPLHRDAVAMNQALLVSSLRQHELTEAADILNTQLQAEMLVSSKTQAALVRSEKLASVGRMAAVTAHEINNPLDAVMNTLYLAQTTDGLPESARQYLKIADGELKRIAHITRQTLGFYRELTQPSTFYAAALLDSVVNLLQARVKSKQAVIEKRCDEKLQITAISGELRQVFANLLLNSLDAIADKGTVKLRVSASSCCGNADRWIRVTIADTGKGIAAATLPHIFEPFFTTKGAIGNGLGLWVSKQIIEKHGGSIRARSTNTGLRTGTVFTVTLPAEPLPQDPAA